MDGKENNRDVRKVLSQEQTSHDDLNNLNTLLFLTRNIQFDLSC